MGTVNLMNLCQSVQTAAGMKGIHSSCRATGKAVAFIKIEIGSLAHLVKQEIQVDLLCEARRTRISIHQAKCLLMDRLFALCVESRRMASSGLLE